MKKLLILMLVLGMTSVAGAALEAVSPVTAGIVTWDVIDDQLVGTGTSLGFYDGYLMSITNATLTVDPLADRSAGLWSIAGDASKLLEPAAGMFATFASDVGSGAQAHGKWFSFDISDFVGTPAAPMTVEIWATPDGATGTIEIIPEPMTIALLGLGGLFLLRRRK